HIADLRALPLHVVLEVLNRFEVPIQRRFLAVGDEHDSIRALQDELPRGVVVDLTRNCVELQLRAHSANFSEVEGEEVEEEGLVAVFLCFPALPDPPRLYAITGGTVHPVSGPEAAKGVVIIRDGLIESVGPNLPSPADPSTIDVKGSHVYPGLIDAQTSLGFP